MPNFLDSLLGKKPTVPNLPTLDLQTEQAKAIAANQANLPASEQLASGANLFNQQQIDQMLQNAIPGFKGISSNISQNISSEVSGQIPKDVADQVQQSAAVQSLAGGFSGTQMGGALLAKDLGLTSLQMTQQGLSSAESWSKSMASMYEPGMMNLTSMFISPSQQASFDNEQNVQQFQRQWMQNQINAQPAMWAQDLKEAVQSALSMYGGAEPQHAGTLPVTGNVSSGDNMNTFGSGANDFSGFGGTTGDYGGEAGF